MPVLGRACLYQSMAQTKEEKLLEKLDVLRVLMEPLTSDAARYERQSV